MPRIAVTQELPPDRVAVRVADPVTGASIARFAQDEGRTENLVSGIRKTGEMPGGHKECSFSLARDPRRDYPDLAPYLDVFLEQAGGEIIWEGRIDKTSESDGEHQAIDVECVGHQVALEDRKGIVTGFIDGDLGKWTEPSIQRRKALGEGNARLTGSMSTGWQGNGESPPGVVFDFNGATTVAGKTERGEAWYYGGGVPLGPLLYHFKRIVGSSGSAWLTTANFSDDDLPTTFNSGPDHDAATNANAYEVITPTGTRFYAFLTSDYDDPGSGTAMTDLHSWEQVKVVAAHGLALQGEWPDVGFTSGQMLRYAVPLFSYLEATEESVEDTGYVIPQAWFSDPGTLAAIVQELTKYELLDWFVMNGKLFEQRQPGTYGRKWQAYVGPSELKDSGIDASMLFRDIKVAWQDVSGRTLTAGPLGSGAMFEDERLEIVDPDHPAVKAGVEREEFLLLHGISTTERSIEAGERWLAETTELTHSGTAVLSGYVMDDKGVRRPVGQVLPGDQISFRDARDTSYRKIVVPDYGHDDRKCQIALDAPSNAMQALLERFDAALVRAGVA